MLMTILSIIANIAYFVVLNLNIYTDRAMMPTGEVREWHRSPVTRLSIADQSFLIYLQIVLAAVSIITRRFDGWSAVLGPVEIFREKKRYSYYNRKRRIDQSTVSERTLII